MTTCSAISSFVVRSTAVLRIGGADPNSNGEHYQWKTPQFTNSENRARELRRIIVVIKGNDSARLLLIEY
jgi:hypothetical protein